ncbi:Guanine nucleotide exchange factor DBS [Bagarius yarrelli]|uniref:Guanine nucleotide exchange factor DBS n=1 Tax=Bagarius yarrelli TaxID=175774 RepID=A0A556U4E7_BAGYA|nr:Guanine nucleotide exchange factor DBS [Bagarius yarrelli]
MDAQNRRGCVRIPLKEAEKYHRLTLCCQQLHNEIMQKETSPIRAADIIIELKKKFAFLSGGRGQDGSPIIIFPEFPAFSEISDQEFHNVLTYLTSVPSLNAARVGFILVIDRRQDRWACVKGTLLRISSGFPGNLRLVLVLRPHTLLQRTLSDIFFKFHGDDFRMKVPDIEGFAVILKRMTQRLQVFGRELAETELPSTSFGTIHLLNIQNSKKNGMKEELAGALEQGRKILGNIREPVCRDPDSTLNPDQLENLATVHRLLSQLNGSSATFDDFWIQHQNKLELSLQLCQFEQNFQQVSSEMKLLNERLAAFSHVGRSQSHTEHLLRELSDQEHKSSEVLDKVEVLLTESHCFTDICVNSDDDVIMKCADLQSARVKFLQELKDKRGLLLQVQDLHKKLQSVCKWCDDGIYMLASQQLDKCQSQEGAESALQELEDYMETGTELQQWDVCVFCREYENVLNKELRMIEKRRISLKKLAAKQTRPVQPVAPTPEAIKTPPSSPALRRFGKSFTVGDSQRDFIEVSSGQNNEVSCTASVSDEEENLAVLRRIFLRELETYTDHPELVGRCFLERMGDLQIYEKYCHNKPRSESLWRQCSDCAFFQEMIKYSKGCDGVMELQAALSSLLGILKAVNDSMHLIAINGYEGNLGDLGRLLMQGSFSVWVEHKRGHVKMMELARFKPMQRHLFLHEKALLFCKRREENGEGYEKAPSYSFKQQLSMSSIGITEHAKGDNKKFEIWLNSRDEVYTVQAASEEIKIIWVREIRKLLTGQLEACREFIRYLPDKQAFLGDRIILSCEANTAKVTASWKKNEQKLCCVDGKHRVYQAGTQCSLDILNAEESDEGNYTVTLSNSSGSESCSAFVRVIGTGKSSTINTIRSILEGRQFINCLAAAESSTSHTMSFERYRFVNDAGSFPFSFNDVMGAEAQEDALQTQDIITALKGHMKEGYMDHQKQRVIYKEQKLREKKGEEKKEEKINLRSEGNFTLISPHSVFLISSVSRSEQEEMKSCLESLVTFQIPNEFLKMRNCYYSRNIQC